MKRRQKKAREAREREREDREIREREKRGRLLSHPFLSYVPKGIVCVYILELKPSDFLPPSFFLIPHSSFLIPPLVLSEN